MQTGNNYAMLWKQPKQPRGHQSLSLQQFKDSNWVKDLAGNPGPIAFDVETNTKNALSPSLYLRCFSVANSQSVLTVDCLECSGEDWEWFKSWIVSQKIIVYNMLYEVQVLFNITKQYITPHADIFMLMKFLGGPEYSDTMVRHSLKAAQVEILDWDTANDDELKTYMKDSGYTWSDVAKFDWQVLSKYSALDADSTWALYEYFKNMCKDYEDIWGSYTIQWHVEDCINAGMLQCESIVNGLKIDLEAMDAYTVECRTGFAATKDKFLTHKDLAPHIAEYDTLAVASIMQAEPKTKETKKGEPSKNYLKWQAKVEAASNTSHFNIQSTQQLAWLLFEKAKYRPTKYGKSGPSVDKESQQSLGEPGKLLIAYNGFKNELKFLEQLRSNNTAGRLHPKVIFPGTDTGRVVSREEAGE
jgi:DNA polymerase I-like protein with 3'-5' exonuclease and polymerase domains